MEFSNRSKYECLLFDLDDTLYPLSSGISKACLKNIQDYLVEKLGIDRSKLDTLCNLLYKNYGTTMAGLRAIGYDFDYDDYHRFVHGRLPYENLKPDPMLRTLLLGLPHRKIIFTNADRVHAMKVLSRMGLEDCFEGIICFETLNNKAHNPSVSIDDEDFKFMGSSARMTPAMSTVGITRAEIFDIVAYFSNPSPDAELPKTPVVCKPSEVAIGRALEAANINPQTTIFFDDSVRNIQAGKRVGLRTVLVGTSHRVKGADHVLESIHNLKEALPELWEAGDSVIPEARYSGKAVVETFVLA